MVLSRNEIVGEVAFRWYELGIELDMDSHFLNMIKTDNANNVKKCCLSMFDELCNKGNLTYQDVVKAIKEIGLGCSADVIREKLSKGEAVRPPLPVAKEIISLPGAHKVLTSEDLASLGSITRMLAADWKPLAGYLIDSCKVSVIGADYPDRSDQAMTRVWGEWVNTAPDDKRTLMYLMQAVKTIGSASMAKADWKHVHSPL